MTDYTKELKEVYTGDMGVDILCARAADEMERLQNELHEQWFALAAVLHSAGPVRVSNSLLVKGPRPGTSITRWDEVDCVVFSGRVGP